MFRHHTILFAVYACLAICAAQVYAEEDGMLTVKTDPEGIEIWLDDKFVGESPVVDKKLKPGRYSLKLVDPVQRTSSVEDVFIQPGQTTVIEKALEGKFGGLKVASQPEGAEVSIVSALGKTPLSNEFMNPGKYRIEVKSPDKRYLPITDEVVIPKGKTVELTKTLQKKNPLDTKALARLVLGAGAVGGYVWAVIQNGQFHKTGDNSAQIQRSIGIAAGSLCVVGFEIVAFF
jgi:hypothetical protein